MLGAGGRVHSRYRPPSGLSVDLSCLLHLKPKTAALAGGGLDANLSAHALDSFLDNGQTDACAGILISLEAGEYPKDFLLILRCDAKAVVFHPDADGGNVWSVERGAWSVSRFFTLRRSHAL